MLGVRCPPSFVDRSSGLFAQLYRVNPADLHKPDLLHNIYLCLFKHMMEWVEGFLKKHKRQQAFDDAWKELQPYPEFKVPKRAHCEVTQWQGKEMLNLSRCISAVLASALRNLNSSQYQDFKMALKCIGALVDFSLMTQYHSHTPDTLPYIESYLQTFHQTCYNRLPGPLVATGDDTYTCDSANMHLLSGRLIQFGRPCLQWAWSPHLHSRCPLVLRVAPLLVE